MLVYARAANESELSEAVENGADGLVAEPFEPYGRACYDTILKIALGKPTAILAGSADKDLLRSAAVLACPDQVTVLFPATHFARLSGRMAEAIRHVADELLAEDMDLPRVSVGTLALTGRTSPDDDHEPVFHLVDLRSMEGKSQDIRRTASAWLSAMPAEQVGIELGSRTRLVRTVVRAGARTLVTAPKLVTRVKDAIREVGPEGRE